MEITVADLQNVFGPRPLNYFNDINIEKVHKVDILSVFIVVAISCLVAYNIHKSYEAQLLKNPKVSLFKIKKDGYIEKLKDS
jgi:hypothetical protein